MKLVRDILTDYDGVTYDTSRCMAVAVIVSMLVFQGVAVWHTKAFDPQAFGVGMGGVLTGLGIAIGGDNHHRPGGGQ